MKPFGASLGSPTPYPATPLNRSAGGTLSPEKLPAGSTGCHNTRHSVPQAFPSETHSLSYHYLALLDLFYGQEFYDSVKNSCNKNSVNLITNRRGGQVQPGGGIGSVRTAAKISKSFAAPDTCRCFPETFIKIK